MGFRRDTYRAGGLDALRVWQIPVQASLLVFVPPATRLQPFLLAGAGYYRIGTTDLLPGAAGHTHDNRFAFHAGAGMDFRVAKKWSVFVDGRFSFLDIGAVAALGTGQRARGWDTVLGVNRYF